MKRRRHQNSELENQNNKDMLSHLPDCILLHILSFLNAKYAVQTCLLSTRWKHLWRCLPTLNLNSSVFSNLKCFSKFVTRMLSLRDSSMALDTLDFERRGIVESYLLIKIVRYAASHNVNHLRLSCRSNQFPFLPSFSYGSLTSLDLCINQEYHQITFPNSLSLNLPTLTYLKLHNLSFCTGSDGRIEPFSTFKKLNTLILLRCSVPDAQQPLCISSTTLLNLSIHTYVTSLNGRYSNIELFAPSLCTLAVTCNSFLNHSGSHLSSIKEVSLVMCHLRYPVDIFVGLRILIMWLVEMTDIESLTVCPTTLEALSLFINKFQLRLPSLRKLKSLQLNVSSVADGFSPPSWRDIKMELAGGKSWIKNVKLREAIKVGLLPKYSSIIDGMIEFLLQNSPSAKVDVV